MATMAANRRIHEFIKAVKSKTLKLSPDFQRRLVWSQKDKRSFIETILEGYPFPEVYVASQSVDVKTGDSIELLVDGQQRISTIVQYFNASKEIELAGEIPTYKDLSPNEQKKFLEYEVVVRNLGSMPLSEIKEVFKRINSTQYSLNAMELVNARYDGAFKVFAEEIAEDEFFGLHNFFTPREYRRMQDTRYVLGLVATIMSNYFNRDELLEQYLSEYNDEFPEDAGIKKQVYRVIELISNLQLDDACRVWKKADFFTLFVELHRAKFRSKAGLKLKPLKMELEKFYEAVDNFDEKKSAKSNVQAYHFAAVQASNDKVSRVRRGEIIWEIIEKCMIKK